MLTNLLDSAIALGNTSPDGGLILLGKLDKGPGFDGCKSLSQDQRNQIEKTSMVFCPDARMKTREVKVVDSSGDQNFAILIRVPYIADRVVKLTNGQIFTRVGDSKHELKDYREIRELESNKGQLSFEQEPSGIPYPDGFDIELVRVWAKRVREKAESDIPSEPEEVLRDRRLGRFDSGKFEPSVAAALLFANDPLTEFPGCKVRFVRYDGTEEHTGSKFNAVKDEQIEGSIPHIIRKTVALLDSQLRTFSPMSSDGRFVPSPEYPRDAWIESIVNAVCHRSYGNGHKNRPVFVKMFDDRIEVESPGGFMPDVTPENIYEIHSPRNPQLQNALMYLDYSVRMLHEGTRRMRASLEEAGLPHPEFAQLEEVHSTVKVTLRNNIELRRVWVDVDVTQLVGAAIAKLLDDDQRRIVNWAAEFGDVHVNDMMKVIDRSYQKTRKVLLSLVQMGVMEWVRFRPEDKRDPKAYFRLTGKGGALPAGAFLGRPPTH